MRDDKPKVRLVFSFIQQPVNLFCQQPLAPPAEPEPQLVGVLCWFVIVGEPLIFGTWGREAAFGLAGLTAPGIPGEFARGLPVVLGGLLRSPPGAGLA